MFYGLIWPCLHFQQPTLGFCGMVLKNITQIHPPAFKMTSLQNEMNWVNHKKKAAIILILTLGIASVLVYSISQEKITYYYTLSEVLASPMQFQKKEIRVMGLVEKQSFQWVKSKTTAEKSDLGFQFTLVDEKGEKLPVFYQGVKPDLFKEGQGVVVEGKWGENGTFQAKNLLVKHSEEYKTNKEHLQSKEDYYKSLELKN